MEMEKNCIAGYWRIRKGKEIDPKVEYAKYQKGYGVKHPEKINGYAGLFFGRGDVFVSETVGDMMRDEYFKKFVMDSLRQFEREGYGDISRGDLELNAENRWFSNGDKVMGRYGFYSEGDYLGKDRFDEVIRIRTWEGNIWISFDTEPDLYILLKSSRKAPEILLGEPKQKNPYEDLEGTEFLKEYRSHSEKFLPLISIQYELTDDVEDGARNLFWNAGIIDENRPYFARCWKIYDVISLDFYVSAQGMERWEAEHFLVQKMIRRGMIAVDNIRKIPPAVFMIKDRTGYEYYMLHLVLKDSKPKQNIRWTGTEFKYEELNRLNNMKKPLSPEIKQDLNSGAADSSKICWSSGFATPKIFTEGDENMEGTELLLDYRAHPGKYLPLPDEQYKHFEKWEDEIIRNHSWGAGLLEENRPYFSQCWSVFDVTMLTVSVSAEGTDPKDIIRMIQDAGLVECVNPEKAKINFKKTVDSNGNQFINVNTVLGRNEEGQFLFWNGKTYKYEELDRINAQTGDRQD